MQHKTQKTVALHPPTRWNLSPRPTPPAFHNANICMHWYAFTFALSLALHYHIGLFVGRGACPSRCTNPCHSHNHCKRTITPSLHTNPSKTALSLENCHHTCLPCQREVDWRQGTNCCSVAFYLRHVRLFYSPNFSAVKTEGLPHPHHQWDFPHSYIHN